MLCTDRGDQSKTGQIGPVTTKTPERQSRMRVALAFVRQYSDPGFILVVCTTSIVLDRNCPMGNHSMYIIDVGKQCKLKFRGGNCIRYGQRISRMRSYQNFVQSSQLQ